MSDGSRLKACRDCQQVFPETAQYFYAEKLKSGIYYKPQCKACHREKSGGQARARYAEGHRRVGRAQSSRPTWTPPAPHEYPNAIPGATWIPLSGKDGTGKFALVDDADAAKAADRRWFYRRIRGLEYAHSRVDSKKSGSYPLHRLIMDAPAGTIVDHINGDGLDNRRSNLRFVTHAENMRNRRHGVGGSSAYKGVSKRAKSAGWTAQITFDKKRIYCGTYPTEEAAARAYDAKAKELFGEYARLNFPE